MTVDEPAKLFLWGADPEGKDVFARTIQGSRISLTIGMVGVLNIIFLGSVLGTVSGYFGGMVDNVIQRFIEVITSIPNLPLWAAMAAALPQDMPVVKRYFFIAILVTFITQIGLARQVRGKVMGYASSDYVAATRAAGGSHSRVIFTHLLPNSTSHIVVFAMLLIPATILGETALSFLGIGMLPPAVSWGTLLQDAQRVEVVTAYPWMLIPAAAVVVAVTCFQLLGDGVRDAVDPYG
jgi:peptide/nickel transport system permease protein